MRKLFQIFLLLAMVLPAGAATVTIIDATVTVTNATTNGMTITVDGDVRTWTNAVFDASTQILTNSTINGSAANLIQHIVSNPFTDVSARLISGTVIRLTGATNANLVVTLSDGWGTVVMNTNPFTSGSIAVRIPYTASGAAQRINIASGLAEAINSADNTNGINAAKLYGSLTNNSETATYVTGAGSPLTNSITGNAATATLADFVSGVLSNSISGVAAFVSGILSNSITGNAATATIATNVLLTANSLASATNSITLNNNYWTYIATTDCAVTNVLTTATTPAWASLAVSNAQGSDITFRMLDTKSRPIGSGTTNALVIAAGKVGVTSFALFGASITNYANAAEQ